MFDLKFSSDDIKIDRKFLRYNEQIVNNPKIHNFLKQTGQDAMVVLKRKMPRNTGIRPNSKDKQMFENLKIGKVRISNNRNDDLEYKSVSIFIFFKKQKAYYKYAIAGRRTNRDGSKTDFKYKWPLAVYEPFIEVWLTSKYQYQEKLRAKLLEVLEDITNKNYD